MALRESGLVTCKCGNRIFIADYSKKAYVCKKCKAVIESWKE